jgi:hypothetical protein
MPAKLFYTGPSLGTLHEEYAKKSRIDEQAPLTSGASITIDAPGPAVWAVISDVAGWPAWYPEFTVLELGEVRPGAPMRWKLGGLTMRSTFAVVNPGRELTWTGRFLGYKAVDQHLLEPAGNGRTIVTIRESLAGPLLPLLYRPSQLQAGHQRWLTALKTTLERRRP